MRIGSGKGSTRPWPKSDAARVSALHYYLMGYAEIQKDFSAAGTELQRQFSLKAIEADPNSQFGYIGLAHSYRGTRPSGGTSRNITVTRR